MRKRLLVGLVTLCSAVFAQQTLTVQRLAEFIHSSTHELKSKQPDKAVAAFIAGIKLSERLDDATIEQFQSEGAGPQTLAALRALRDRSANLPAPKSASASAGVDAKPMPPPPSSEEQAAILDSIRSYALNYSQNLPDFICVESMKTYQAPGRSDNWVKVNDVASKLTFYQQKEDYRTISENGKISNQDYEKLKSSKSVGDFGSMLRGIFEPASEARFEWRTWSTWDGRPSMTFSYHVPRDRSNYQISVDDRNSITAGYGGYFVVDVNSHAIMKFNVTAENLPADFSIKSAETTLVYREQDLSGHTFLLPESVQVIMSGGGYRDRIDKRFSVYRKYTANSEISFDSIDDTPPPVKKKR